MQVIAESSLPSIRSISPPYAAHCVFVFGPLTAGPKFLTALFVNKPASTTTHTARAVSGSSAAAFSAPAAPSHPVATWCASVQNGWACVRRA